MIWKYLVVFCLSIPPLLSFPQAIGQRYRVMFYNVENLFDPFNDSLTSDDEFTPEGVRHWSWEKMNLKINGIYKTIMGVGEWDPPVLVGLCEVENGMILNRLVRETPISKFEYRFVHRDSPDPRGIDVALLYRPDRFMILDKKFIRVIFKDEPERKSRDILYVSGLLNDTDTLHVFVNHWPSKHGGELESESGRYAAAYLVRQKIDSIRVFYPKARLIIMGDFNDEPESETVVNGLGACPSPYTHCPSGLINLSANLKSSGQGSYKYQGVWGMIDQIIVSSSLLDQTQGLHTDPSKISVFQADYLIEQDQTFVGTKPFRTYTGYKFNGGYSDHLPVYIDLTE